MASDEFTVGYRAGITTGMYGALTGVLHEIEIGTPLDKMKSDLVESIEHIKPLIPDDIVTGLQGVLNEWDEGNS